MRVRVRDSARMHRSAAECAAFDAVRIPCGGSMTWVRYRQVVHKVGHGFCGEPRGVFARGTCVRD